jgi:hypothetical protein
MALITITYRISNAEQDDRRKTAKKDSDPVLILTGTIATSRDGGKTFDPRKTERLVITRAMAKRDGFSVKSDNAKRVVTVNLPSEKTGRKRKTGTNLDILNNFTV